MKKKTLSLALALLMCFSLTSPAFASQPAADGAYSAMIALKDQYPEGTHWTNDNYYGWSGGIYSGGYGCAGFAFMLSDAAFGALPAQMLESFSYDDIQVGDILRNSSDTHSVIVLEVYPDYLVLAEGNYNDSIHWGRKLPKSEALQSIYLITRYQEDAPAAVSYTISFDPNGGTVPVTSTRTDANGQITIPLPIPTREGYAFAGWFTGDGYQARDNDTWGGDQLLTAQWNRIDDRCTVTFQVNTRIGLANPKSLVLDKGDELELPNDPKWEGYTFLGWYSGTVEKNRLKDPVQWEEGDKVLEDLTLYALWEEEPAEPEPTAPPVIEVENIPAAGTALASTQTVTVDGRKVEFQMYALKDANGNLTNYIKLRDMAYVLDGTKAQFAVGYDGTISLTTGRPYQAGGTEMTTPFSGNRAYKGGAQTLKIDGKDVAMTAITLTDDNGGGYNYFKLRDLGKALGFNVGYSNENGVFIESDKPYAE